MRTLFTPAERALQRSAQTPNERAVVDGVLIHLAADSPLASVTCLGCGKPIEKCLSRLGSTTCQDCRPSSNPLRAA